MWTSFCDLALEQPGDGDAGPARDDLGDVVGVDLLLEEDGLEVASDRRLRRRRCAALWGRVELPAAFRARGSPVAKLGGALEVGGALGALDLAAGLLEAVLQRADVSDRVLLGLPLGLHGGGALALLGELALDRLAALGGGGVGLLGERGQLDLELHHAAVDLVDLGRQRVDLDAQPRGGLVDQVDRLVGQEAVGDVAVRELAAAISAESWMRTPWWTS